MDIKSEMNCDFETTDFAIPNKKCGEIFVKTDKTSIIVCTFCNIPFTEFTQFTTHYAHNHSNKHINLSDREDDQIHPVKIQSYDVCTEFTQYTVHAYNNSDKYNNLSDRKCDEIHPIKIEPCEGLSESNINGSVSVLEINQCNNDEADIIDSNTKDDLILLNESSEIVKSKLSVGKEKSTKILNKSRDTNISPDFDYDLSEKKFLSEENVEKHKKIDHLPLDPKKCRYCDRKYSCKSNRIIHERSQHTGERPFKCQFCDKLFSAREHLKRHESRHNKPFHCDLCEKKFSTEEKMENHKKYDHLPSDPSVDSAANLNESNEVDPKKCRFCDRKYSHKYERINHERFQHTGERPFKCQFCDKLFSVRRYLKRHESRHIHTNPLHCDLCEKKFSSEEIMENHKKYDHLPSDPFVHSAANLNKLNEVDSKKCRFCDRKFPCRRDRIDHERSQHTGERPFKCQFCDKFFSARRYRYQHERLHIHTVTDKPFHCDLCEKKFSTEEILGNHKKYDHLPSDPFVDPAANLNESNEVDLKKCRFCNRKFPCRSDRIDHERSQHTGETPFKCQFCDKLFSARQYLKQHEKIHIRTNRYHCDLCEKKFLTAEILENHKKYDHLSSDPFVDSAADLNESNEVNPKKCRS